MRKILFLLLSLVLATMVNAQNIGFHAANSSASSTSSSQTPKTGKAASATVANGTITYDRVPVYGYYVDNYQHSQVIYSQSDLVSAGLPYPCTITKLTYYLSSPAVASWGNAIFKVTLGATTATAMPSTPNSYLALSNPVKVYSGSLDATSSTMVVEFTTPFVYEGGNLVIDIQETTKGTYKSATFYGVTGSGVGAYGTNSNGLANITSPTRVDFMPKTTFDFTPLSDPTIVISPSSTTVFTGFSTTLDASMFNADEATINWESDDTGVATVSADGQTATVTGVAEGTTTITASMTVDGVEYTASATITVEDPYYCTPAPTSVDGGNGGITNVTFGSVDNSAHPTSKPFYGDYSSLAGYVEQGEEALVAITFETGYTYGTLIWVDWNKDYVFGDDEIVYMGTSTNANPTTLEASFDIPMTVALGDYRMRIGAADSYFDSYIGGNTTAAHDPCFSGTYMVFHDYTLRATAPATCIKPQELIVSDITSTGAVLSWTSDETNFDYVYGLTGFTPDWNNAVSHNNTTLVLSGLSPVTGYDFYVRTNCGGGDVSNPVKTSFKTPCDVITSLPWSENFNSYTGGSTSSSAPSSYPNDVLPDCWQFLNRSENSSTPQVFISSNSGYPVSGNCLFFKSSNSTPIYAILPSFAEETNSLQLSFTYRNEGVSTSNGTLHVGYMTNPADASTFTSVYTCAQTTTLTTPTPVTFEEAPDGSYIAFKYEGGSSNNYYLSIDNVTVSSAEVCEPTYTSTDGYYYIAEVNIMSNGEETLSNNTTGTANSYSDFYATKSFLASPSEVFSLEVKPAYNGESDGKGYGVFIDYGSDGMDAGDRILTAGSQSSTYSATFTIPSTTSYGSYRMRIVQNYSSSAFDMTVNDPCGTFEMGETEDYKMIVVPDYAVTVAAGITGGTIIPSASRAKEGQTVTLDIEPDAGWHLIDLTVVTTTGNTNIPVSGLGNTLTFTMPAKDVAINATFDSDACSIYSYGEETGTSSSPIIGGLRYAYTQTIYTAEQMGLTNNKTYSISKISWNSETDNWFEQSTHNYLKYDITIYIGTTDKTVFEGTSRADLIPISEMTEVYSVTQGTIHAGWNEYVLNTPFEYQAASGQNLVVAVYSAIYNSGSAFDSPSFYCTPVSGNQEIHVWSQGHDTRPENCDDNTWGLAYIRKARSKNIPDIKIKACLLDDPIRLWTEAVTTRPSTFPDDETITAGGTDYAIPLTCEEDLAWFISYVNGLNGCDTHSSAKAIVTADLDMKDYIWVPINNYSGQFNGDFHTIANLHSNEEDGYADLYQCLGMFGTIADGAAISNAFVIDVDFASSYADGYMGGLVGKANGSGIVEFCEAAGTLTALGNLACVGGVVGEATGNNAYLTRMYALMSYADINYGANNITYVGGVVGNKGSLQTAFADNDFIGTGSVTNFRAIGNLAVRDAYTLSTIPVSLGSTVLTEGGGFAPSDYTGTDATGKFSDSDYSYGADNNTVEGIPLVNLLNEVKASGYKWTRAAGSDINGGYPIIVPDVVDDSLAVVLVSGSGKAIRFGYLNQMISKYRNVEGAQVYMYNNDVIEQNITSSDKLKLYIDENVAVRQDDDITVNATVGITLKNTVAGSGEMSRDWHTFSTSLSNASTGIGWAAEQSIMEFSESPLQFGSESNQGDYWFTEEESSYFPTGIDNGLAFDFYAFSEPDYHWINYKRNSNNHWHSDGNNAQITYENETVLRAGEGYLVALGNNSDKNNNLMQATGELNNVPEGFNITIPVTATEGSLLKGYNLLGNPFQSYLDFQIFADVNKYIWENPQAFGYHAYVVFDADDGGFLQYLFDSEGQGFSENAANTAGRYINMHQGFFVVRNGTSSYATFDNTMRVIDQSPNFRDEKAPHYPLVNMFCTDSDGKHEVAVIELERRTMAGSLKMKGMLNGKGNMYIHWGEEDFGAIFIDHMPEYIPVWFEAAEDGIFTMSWNTQNAEFDYLHLIDNIAGFDYDCLANDSYTFEARSGDMAARFRLVFKPLGIEEGAKEDEGDFAFAKGTELIVNGEGELSIIDLNGRVLAKEFASGQQSHIALPKVADGIYLLRLAGSDNVRIQKIVINK